MKTRIDARLLMAVAVTAFFAASVYSGIGAWRPTIRVAYLYCVC